MQEKKIRERIISLVNKEVVPAIGCTCLLYTSDAADE